jgi:thiol-disulfide isomerase/thioredoxin
VRRSLCVSLLLLAYGCGEEEAAPPAPVVPPEAPPAGPSPRELVEMPGPTVRDVLAGQPAPVLLVNVWSTWCDPCLEEMPGLIELGRSYRPRGVQLVLISVDARTERDNALRVLRQNRAPEPAFWKSGPDDPFIEALHPEWSGALPVTLLLDRDRRVRRMWEEPVSRAMLSGPIEALLDEG